MCTRLTSAFFFLFVFKSRNDQLTLFVCYVCLFSVASDRPTLPPFPDERTAAPVPVPPRSNPGIRSSRAIVRTGQALLMTCCGSTGQDVTWFKMTGDSTLPNEAQQFGAMLLFQNWQALFAGQYFCMYAGRFSTVTITRRGDGAFVVQALQTCPNWQSSKHPNLLVSNK